MVRDFIRKTGLAATIGAAFLVMLFVVPSTSNAQGQSGRVFINENVATVNGETIKEDEFIFSLLREYGSPTFDDMVENQTIVEQAPSLGVTIEPTDIDAYLASAYQPEVLQSLQGAFGDTLLRNTIGTELLAFKTVMAKIDEIVEENKIDITDDQIQQFYIANLPAWTRPESVRFSLIETDTQAESLAARARIVAGEAFGDVAKQVSIDEATRSFGGDVGGLVPKGYSTGDRASLEKAAFSLGINEISQPIQAEKKWFLIMPTEKGEYYEPPLSEVRDSIHTMILDSIVEPYLTQWSNDLREQAKIEITYPVYQPDNPTNFTPGENGSFLAPVVVIINGTKIVEGQFFFHLLTEHGGEVLHTLLMNAILDQEAAKLDLLATTDEVRNHLSEVYDPAKLAVLDAAFGPDLINQSFQREFSAIGVLGKKVQDIIKQENIQITEDQVLQAYLNNLKQWSRPEMVRFSVIITNQKAEADAARKRISGGEDWTKVCKDVSTNGPTKENGGDIGDYIQRGSIKGESKAIEDTAFSLAIGAVSQPVQIGESWFLIKVTDKQAAYEPSLSEMHDEIFAKLQQEQVAPFIKEWQKALWEGAKIDVTYPIYANNPSPNFTNAPK